MIGSYNPVKAWQNAMQVGFVMAEAQMVIGMRVMGFAGLWSVSPSENSRMISEKVNAIAKSSADASRTALRGGSADAIAAAAIKPIRRATRSNQKRLTRRGPKGR